jgi:hypothetical protein
MFVCMHTKLAHVRKIFDQYILVSRFNNDVDKRNNFLFNGLYFSVKYLIAEDFPTAIMDISVWIHWLESERELSFPILDTNISIDWLTILFRSREIPGSGIGQDTRYPDVFAILLSTSEKELDSTFKRATTLFFYSPTNSPFWRHINYAHESLLK